MAKFLTTTGSSQRIEEILRKAKNEIFIVTPYLKLSDTMYQRLRDASSREVKITVVYGKKDLNDKEYKKLGSIDNIKVFYCNNLHAKCYCNEEDMVITSMNLYESSLGINREMGIYINRKSDKELYTDGFEEVRSIINASELDYEDQPSIAQNGKGFCITCRTSITLDIMRPFCLTCFKEWSKSYDEWNTENYCLDCGDKERTSMRKPVCYSCYTG